MLDDKLDPTYPGLVEIVHKWLRAHPDWLCLTIPDREDIMRRRKT